MLSTLSPIFNCRFCGSQRPPRVTSSSNVMTIQFRSDSSIQRTGFRAWYYAVNDPGEIENEFPLNKLSNLTFCWDVVISNHIDNNSVIKHIRGNYYEWCKYWYETGNCVVSIELTIFLSRAELPWLRILHITSCQHSRGFRRFLSITER